MTPRTFWVSFTRLSRKQVLGSCMCVTGDWTLWSFKANFGQLSTCSQTWKRHHLVVNWPLRQLVLCLHNLEESDKSKTRTVTQLPTAQVVVIQWRCDFHHSSLDRKPRQRWDGTCKQPMQQQLQHPWSQWNITGTLTRPQVFVKMKLSVVNCNPTPDNASPWQSKAVMCITLHLTKSKWIYLLWLWTTNRSRHVCA